ncbi:hypothetical protein MJD09_23220 [bacterium]|nr:hypothetical protein [bacterium]
MSDKNKQEISTLEKQLKKSIETKATYEAQEQQAHEMKDILGEGTYRTMLKGLEIGVATETKKIDSLKKKIRELS